MINLDLVLEEIFVSLAHVVRFLGADIAVWLIGMLPVYVVVCIIVFGRYNYLKSLKFWILFIFLSGVSLFVMITAVALGAWG